MEPTTYQSTDNATTAGITASLLERREIVEPALDNRKKILPVVLGSIAAVAGLFAVSVWNNRPGAVGLMSLSASLQGWSVCDKFDENGCFKVDYCDSYFYNDYTQCVKDFEVLDVNFNTGGSNNGDDAMEVCVVDVDLGEYLLGENWSETNDECNFATCTKTLDDIEQVVSIQCSGKAFNGSFAITFLEDDPYFSPGVICKV